VFPQLKSRERKITPAGRYAPDFTTQFEDQSVTEYSTGVNGMTAQRIWSIKRLLHSVARVWPQQAIKFTQFDLART